MDLLKLKNISFKFVKNKNQVCYILKQILLAIFDLSQF